jgi:phosphate transport system protein
MKRLAVRTVRARLRQEETHADALVKMMDVSRHLERIADLATNMAEDVIYLAEGIISRHQQPESEE